MHFASTAVITNPQPRQRTFMTHTSSASFKFIVIGGSVAGLCAAYALAEGGHQVVVLEQRPAGSKVEGVLRCPPNMTRVLQTMPGAEVLFEQQSARCERLTFKDGETLATIGRMIFRKEIMEDFQANYYLIQYQCLIDLLNARCREKQVCIKYGTQVTDIERNANGIRALLSDGTFEEGDLVVAADGRTSSFRETISEEDVPPPSREVLGCTFVVPWRAIGQRPQFDELRSPHEYFVITGNASTSTISYNPYYDHLNVNVFYGETLDGKTEDDFNSSQPFPTIDMDNYDTRLQELTKLAQHCHATAQKVVQIDEWVGLDNRAVLIGDAAHSSLVHGSYNSAMAVEDAFVLGRLFSYAASYRQIPFLLNAYQEIRQPRNEYTTQAELNAFALLSLPPGEYKNARDQALRGTLVDAKELVIEDALAREWADYVTVYSFNPHEAVDDWWTKWGRKMQEYI